MLHRIPMPGRVGWLFAGFLLFSLSLWAQSVGAKDEVKHYGYSGADKVLDCLRQVYGKPAAGFPGIKFPRAADFHCPNTKDGISQWLQNDASSTPAGIHLFETSEWVYIIPQIYVAKVYPAARLARLRSNGRTSPSSKRSKPAPAFLKKKPSRLFPQSFDSAG